MHEWDDLLSDEDREVLRRGGYGFPAGLGTAPAVLVIDCQKFMLGEDAPVLDQIDRYPSACGHAGWNAVRTMAPLLAAARQADVPVIYVRTAFKAARLAWVRTKTKRDLKLYSDGHADTEFVEVIAPREDDLVVDKFAPDAFLGTPLAAYLIGLNIDTLVLVGGSASGCVSATAFSGAALNFRLTVVHDCVFDRIGVLKRAALLNLWRSLADVRSAAEVIRYFTSEADNDG